MRLFVASGIFHPEPGGPATYLHELLPELIARGWEIRVLSFADKPYADHDYPYPVTRILRRRLPLRIAQYQQAALPLMRWADVIYVHSLGLPLMSAGRSAPRVVKIVGDIAWERAVRRGWFAPTEDIDVFQTRSYDPRVRLDRSRRAREARAMNGVIVPSEYLKRMVVGWGVNAAKVQVIYNALPPANVPQISQAEARSQLSLPDAPTVLTVGRLLPWKGVDHLIAALRRAPDVRLIVAGDGDILDALKAQAADLGERVQFLGRVSREQMPLYMKAADYVALYSGYEGLSHTLLESLRVGTPVIASDKGGNPEVVQHGVNGLLVPYVDVEALAAALQEAFRSGVRESLAANSSVGMERFDFGGMVDATAAALERFTPENPRR